MKARTRAFGMAIACTLALPAAASADASALIGQIVPPYPDGLANTSGSCVGEATDPQHICDYAIAVLADAHGQPRFLLAEKAHGHQGQTAIWFVLDALPYPALAVNQAVVFGQCQRNGVDDARLVAVLDTAADVEWFDQVDRVWQLDLAQARFVEASVEGVRCLNEGFGYDG